MLFINVNKAAGDRIIDLETSLWECFGSNAVKIEYKDTCDLAYALAIFDAKSNEVFYISVEVPGQPQAFQWINQDVKEAYYRECYRKKIDPQIAWDNINFTNVETEELILEYLKDIGEGYYDNLPVVDRIPVLTEQVATMPPKNSYNVKLDIRMEFAVDANSMDEAVAKARKWHETSKTNYGEGDDVYWADHYIIKESAEKHSQD